MKTRVPPGQRLSRGLIPLQIEDSIPQAAANSWQLKVGGLVSHHFSWDISALKASFHDRLQGDFHCVTGWSVLDLVWEGLRLNHLLELVKPLAEVEHVLFQAESGYSTNLSLDFLRQEPAIIAWNLNELPIPPVNGGPLRLFVPGKYAYKSLKWIVSVLFLEREERGYWESRGYSNSADPWKEERYS